MKAQNYTRLSIDVPNDLHKMIKFHIIEKGINIKNYVLNLIQKDLNDDVEDYLLGQMALKSKKEGSLGVKESEKFFKTIKKSLSNKSLKKTSHHKKTVKNEKVKSI